MKTLFLDCGMGAAGDMLTAALLELFPERDNLIKKLNSLGIPGVKIKSETAVKCGITGTHITVTVDGVEESEELFGHEHHDHRHEHSHHHHHDHDEEHHHHGHHHSDMHAIGHIVDALEVPQKVKEDIRAVYGLIAEAESHAHGVPVTDIHFHEVGTMDAVADVTAVCLLMHELNVDEVVASPVNTGGGQVKCAHGILPVPAPATAYILRDVPIYDSGIKSELCTPTGAALLKHFVTRFGSMPVMKTRAIGYGMGKKDFSAANCVRALLGETADTTETVPELSCNVDDMTAEEIGFAAERLFDGGALEVYTVPIGMKKSRPGTLIRVLCREQDKDKIIGLLFKHTTTIGVREITTRRYILDRRIEAVETPYGRIRRKVSSGYGVTRTKVEYEDIAHIAQEQNISFSDAQKRLADE